MNVVFLAFDVRTRNIRLSLKETVAANVTYPTHYQPLNRISQHKECVLAVLLPGFVFQFF
jgi:hypothetical protein